MQLPGADSRTKSELAIIDFITISNFINTTFIKAIKYTILLGVSLLVKDTNNNILANSSTIATITIILLLLVITNLQVTKFRIID